MLTNSKAFFRSPETLPIPTTDLISWIFGYQQYDPHKKIYIDAADVSRSITAIQAKDIIRRLVKGFQDAGLQYGDCVLIHSFNDIYYPMLVLGIIGAGGVFTGSNPSYTSSELSHHIKTADVKFIITEPEISKNILTAAQENGISTETNVWIFHPLKTQKVLPGLRSWEELLSKGESDWVTFDDERLSMETTACRLFSSGTTGLPKAVELSHGNLVAQHTLVNEYRRACNVLPLPMFHAACVPSAHTSPLRGGVQGYVLRRFDLELFLSTIQNQQITDLVMVPPLIVAVVMSPLTKKYSLNSVKTVRCGAAPLSKEMQARFKTILRAGWDDDEEGKIRDLHVTQVWGMTETSCVATKFWQGDEDDTGSVGRLLPNMEAKLVDDDGKDISAYDIPGELCIKGPIVVRGYFRNPTANSHSYDSDGFFHTGDVAICNSETKKWYIVDRKKELIKVRGFQVAPPELEAVLLEHPGIVDAGVIGVTNPTDASTEFPRAYVVRRPGSTVDEKAVLEWVKVKVAGYKAITGGVVFLESIPKNASGKILKRVLREMAKEEMEREEIEKAKL